MYWLWWVGGDGGDGEGVDVKFWMFEGGVY